MEGKKIKYYAVKKRQLQCVCGFTASFLEACSERAGGKMPVRKEKQHRGGHEYCQHVWIGYESNQCMSDHCLYKTSC